MAFTLSKLPYAMNALEPHISKRTLEFHHGKHHASYVDKLNRLVEGSRYAKMDLREVMLEAAAKKDAQGIFNNAAQAWNHAFFWESMRPGAGGEPPDALAGRLRDDLGGYAKFRSKFVEVATARFGSGWAWLVLDAGKLAVTSTPNAENPLLAGQVPLLTCDVWEHAYYLDYQNRRQAFVEAFLDHLVNWDHVAAQLREAHSRPSPRAAAAA